MQERRQNVDIFFNSQKLKWANFEFFQKSAQWRNDHELVSNLYKMCAGKFKKKN